MPWRAFSSVFRGDVLSVSRSLIDNEIGDNSDG